MSWLVSIAAALRRSTETVSSRQLKGILKVGHFNGRRTLLHRRKTWVRVFKRGSMLDDELETRGGWDRCLWTILLSRRNKLFTSPGLAGVALSKNSPGSRTVDPFTSAAAQMSKLGLKIYRCLRRTICMLSPSARGRYATWGRLSVGDIGVPPSR